MTVSGMQAKIMEYQPDVVFIDGAYLMQSELPKVEQGSAQALTEIARGLKKLAQSQRHPDRRHHPGQPDPCQGWQAEHVLRHVHAGVAAVGRRPARSRASRS